MASTAEVDAMQRAIVLAQAAPSTHPNPRVGALVLDADGAVVAAGIHRGPGLPHAEVEALTEAGSRASGGTMVVTLEPCNHTGRTGPCTAALLTAQVARVVFAQVDPNPRASGGAAALQAAGVDVEGDVLAPEARDINLLWSLAMERERPFVTWKVAATVDGRVAAADGTSRWITGSTARREVHRLRAAADAVMVGTTTVLIDDPQLTARDDHGELVASQPLRVVVGMREMPSTFRIFDDAAPTVQLRTHDPKAVLQQLFERDVHHVLLEGGPTLAAAFIEAQLVDRVIGYVAPALLGDGPSLVSSLAVTTISDACALHFDQVGMAGDDIRWQGRFTDSPTIPWEGGS